LEEDRTASVPQCVGRFCHAGLIRVESSIAKEGGVEISRSVLIPDSVEAMFDLIEQAEWYPSFLPWCTAAEILERSEDWVAARLEISYAKLRFEMRTRNPKRRPEWLQLRLVEGPFRQFHGDWRLVPLADLGCKLTFSLSYQTSEGLFDRVAKVAMDRIFDAVVDAFVKRAEATLTPLGAPPSLIPGTSPSPPVG
jgi:ribosome-associated toxin RatA of RatAB toxin-antitoxin module